MIAASLSHYRIIKKLGAGGMGEVYLAQDTKLERTVALKILPADVAQDQQRMRRFVQEAKAASALNHPNILTIHEVGEDAGINFIATEFIEGKTLRQCMKSARMKLGEALDVAVQTADALAAAHEAGIIHRDIKPENIMLRRRDAYVKVLDFGLAKLIEQPPVAVDTEAPTKTLFKTEEGVVIGTVAYMSPEQVKGGQIDARTDIFSLGIVLYEMVAGCLPFEGSNSSEVMASILSDKEPQPLARYSREVPPELERIVSKALRKEREQRYQSVKDLMLDLQSLKQELEFAAKLERSTLPDLSDGAIVTARDGQMISDDPGPPFQNAGLSARRPRSRKAINSLAVLPLVNASPDPDMEYLSDGISESLINNLSQLPKLRVMARATVFRYKGREVDPQEVGRELNVRAVLAGRVLQRENRLIIKVELVNSTDGSQLWGEQYNRSPSDILEVEEEISREISRNLRLKLSGEQKKLLTKRYTDDTEAYRLYLKGRYYGGKWTEEGWKKGVEYFNQAIDVDRNYALAYAGMANSYVKLGLFGAMAQRDAYPKAKAAALQALDIDDTLAEAHASLGLVKMIDDWDWPGVRREYERAIEINPNFAEVYQLYGYHLIHMGRYDEAIAKMKRAEELDPLSLEYMTSVGDAYYYGRQYDKAIKQLRKTREMDPNFGEARIILGFILGQEGRYEEAIAEMQKAVELTGNTPKTVASLGHAYALSGRRDEAQKIIEELKELSNRRYVDPGYIAIIYTGLGEKDQAFDWLEKAFEDHSAWMVHIKAEPLFDSLRSDRRFQELMRRVGLPQ